MRELSLDAMAERAGVSTDSMRDWLSTNLHVPHSPAPKKKRWTKSRGSRNASVPERVSTGRMAICKGEAARLAASTQHSLVAQFAAIDAVRNAERLERIKAKREASLSAQKSNVSTASSTPKRKRVKKSLIQQRVALGQTGDLRYAE